MWHPESYGRRQGAFKAHSRSIALSFKAMDTLALRLAAADGRLDDVAVRPLVAAGFTLLQRSAPLVRALSGRRAGLLLPPSPAVVVALAASDGRGAAVLDPASDVERISARVGEAGIGAIFTVRRLLPLVPAGVPAVLLDEAPVAAEVRAADGAHTRVDLGTHFGLAIEGATDVPGRDEECLLLDAPGDVPLTALTHRVLLQRADWTAPILRSLITPLLQGEHIHL